MQNIPIRDCGDGFVRADVASYSPLKHKTASYTVLRGDIGALLTNKGAGGAITFTLPTPKAGDFVWFLKHAQQNLTITATGGAKINGGSANGSIANTAAESLKIIELFSDGTDWFISGSTGTWA